MTALKTSLSSLAVALTVISLGTVGTAYAATPASPGPSVVAEQNPPPRPPPPPPHRFRMKFSNLQQCQARAMHDHPGRPGDWDCRRGPDRANPWEYWGN